MNEGGLIANYNEEDGVCTDRIADTLEKDYLIGYLLQWLLIMGKQTDNQNIK